MKYLLLALVVFFADPTAGTNQSGSKMTCNHTLVGRYIESRSFELLNNFPVKSSAEVKSICPRLEETCCSYKELLDMSQVLKDKLRKAKALAVLFGQFIKRLSNLKSKNTDKLFKTSMTDLCSGYTKQEFSVASQYVKQFSEEVAGNFAQLLEVDVQYNSGFVCGLCNPENHHAVVGRLDGSYGVNVNINSCLKYIPRVADFLPNVIYSFHKVEVLVKTMGCDVGLPFSLDLSINHKSQKNTFEEEMRKCSTAEYIQNSPRCIEFCNLGILNNFWGSFVVDVIQVANLILDEWDAKHNLNYYSDAPEEVPFTYDQMKFQFFIRPRKSITGLNIEDYVINIVDTQAWNLFENEITLVNQVGLPGPFGLFVFGFFLLF